jgi:adenylosuccinate synthase
VLRKCEPIYDEFAGWDEITRDGWTEIVSKGYTALPENLKKYLEYIELKSKTPVKIISVGPGREDTIMKD